MIGYLVLLISLIAIWRITLRYNGGDYLKPSSIIVFLQIFSVIFAIVGLSSWNSKGNDISILTYFIVVVSSILAVSGCFFADKYRFKAINSSKFRKRISARLTEKENIAAYRYTIGIGYYFILLFVEIVLMYLYYHFLCITFGTTNIAKLVYFGHEYYFWPSLVKNAGAQTIARYCFKLVKCISYAFIFTLSYNIAVKGKGKIRLIPPIILFILGWLLDGSRHNAMLTLIAIILLSYVISKKVKPNGNRAVKKSKKRRRVILIVFASIAVIYFFISFANLWAGHNANPLAYGSFTFGCSIPTMNEALEIRQGFDSLRAFGSTTFRGIYKLLRSMNLITGYNETTKGWIIFSDASGTTYASNTFSAAYNLYFDFGFIGMMFFSFLEGLFYEKIYLIAKKARKNEILPMIIFAFFLPSLFNWFRTEDLISSNLIEISTYFMIPLTVIIIKTFFKRVKNLEKMEDNNDT